MRCIFPRMSGRAAVVVVGLLLVWWAAISALHWLSDADPVAALFVAGVVVYVSWRLARKTIDALLDGLRPGCASKIVAAVSKWMACWRWIGCASAAPVTATLPIFRSAWRAT